MNSHSPLDSSHTPTDADLRSEEAPDYGRLPNRLLTAYEVAKFVGCHEETGFVARICAACSSRNASVFEEGGFTRVGLFS